MEAESFCVLDTDQKRHKARRTRFGPSVETFGACNSAAGQAIGAGHTHIDLPHGRFRGQQTLGEARIRGGAIDDAGWPRRYGILGDGRIHA
jgi:hypothetical protein